MEFDKESRNNPVLPFALPLGRYNLLGYKKYPGKTEKPLYSTAI